MSMNTIITAATTAVIVSVVCCKIMSRIIFEIIDKYVKDMVELAKKSIRDAYRGKGST